MPVREDYPTLIIDRFPYVRVYTLQLNEEQSSSSISGGNSEYER
jgi:hypothetical protein